MKADTKLQSFKIDRDAIYSLKALVKEQTGVEMSVNKTIQYINKKLTDA